VAPPEHRLIPRGTANPAHGKAPRRKRRTRGHVIANLSANHVERFVLECGFAAEVTRHDYGVDMMVFFYGTRGGIRDGQVMLQLKATDSVKTIRGGTVVTFNVARADLAYWLDIAQPVILIVYDAAAGKAYWRYVQAGFTNLRGSQLPRGKRRFTVHLPVRNVVGRDAVRQWQRYNDAVVAQQRGKIRHDE